MSLSFDSKIINKLNGQAVVNMRVMRAVWRWVRLIDRRIDITQSIYLLDSIGHCTK